MTTCSRSFVCAVVAVQADNLTMDLAPSVPVDPVGYRALRLAFHPGDASAGDRPAASPTRFAAPGPPDSS